MAQTNKIKAGTRIKVRGYGLNGEATFEFATIKRGTKGNVLPDGFYPVRFDVNGGTLCVHETNFVIAAPGEAPELDKKEVARLDRNVRHQYKMARALLDLMASAA